MLTTGHQTVDYDFNNLFLMGSCELFFPSVKLWLQYVWKVHLSGVDSMATLTACPYLILSSFLSKFDKTSGDGAVSG